MSIKREELHSTDFSGIAIKGKRLPITEPGEILLHDFMEPLGLSANALGNALNVPPNRITGILKKQRAITADTALRLSRYFGNSAQFWLTLQVNYELEVARLASGAQLQREIKPRAA